jgi:enoyl-CoA hydratase/carnithine racemase
VINFETLNEMNTALAELSKDSETKVLLIRGSGTKAFCAGIALGGGCEIIAGCDMAIASEKAMLGQPEVQLGGLAPAAAALFPRIMGEKKAFELIVLGDSIPAKEAERIGLVNKVVADEELDKAAEELAAKFLKKSSLSVKLVRDAVYQCSNISELDKALDKATELGINSWSTGDGQEGLKSYLEKRPPNWKNI